MPLSDKDLARFIAENGLEASFVYPDAPTPTVPAAAAALGVAARSIIKSLVFLAGDAPLLVIAAGESLIDHGKLRKVVGVSRRKLRIATPEAALAISGYEVGAMPPFGHLEKLPTYIDVLTVTGGTLYGGGGTKASMLRLSLATLLRVTEGQVVSLTKETV